MRLLPALILCAALGIASNVRAQAPADAPAKVKPAKTGTAASKTKAKGDEKEAATEDAADKKKKVHVVAIMEVKIGRETGQVMFELFPGNAPKTVENFRANADSKFYDGLAVHRAVKDYLVQTGDPASRDDKAREKWGLTQERTIPGEFKRPHTVGAVAMARRGDDVNPERKSDGSQFYFALGDLSALDGQYTVFGQVVSGMPVLKKISQSVTDSNDCPVVRIEIKKLRVIEMEGPMVTTTTTPSGHKTKTKPDALKGPFERFIERIW